MATVVIGNQEPLLGGDAVNENDLTIVGACCCANQALYTSLPDCIGCSGKATVCCLEVAQCCKPGAPCLFPFGCLGLRWVPCTLLKAQHQACCLVSSVALPTDDEVPAMVNCLGCSCFPKCGCCMRQGEITGTPVVMIMRRDVLLAAPVPMGIPVR